MLSILTRLMSLISWSILVLFPSAEPLTDFSLVWDLAAARLRSSITMGSWFPATWSISVLLPSVELLTDRFSLWLIGSWFSISWYIFELLPVPELLTDLSFVRDLFSRTMSSRFLSFITSWTHPAQLGPPHHCCPRPSCCLTWQQRGWSPPSPWARGCWPGAGPAAWWGRGQAAPVQAHHPLTVIWTAATSSPSAAGAGVTSM